MEAEASSSAGPPPPPVPPRGRGRPRKAPEELAPRPKAKARGRPKSAAGPLPTRERSSSAKTVAYPEARGGRSASIASVAETVTYKQDEAIAPAIAASSSDGPPPAAPGSGRIRAAANKAIKTQALAAQLKAAKTSAIVVEKRAVSEIPYAEPPKRKPRIRTVSLTGRPTEGPTLPIAKEPRKRATSRPAVVLPTVGFMPIRRPKGQAARAGTPYGSKGRILSARNKQLIDGDNEALNVPVS